MKIIFSLLIINIFLLSADLSGQMISPKQYFGYEIGEKFTYHHKVVDYFEHVSENSEFVKIEQYGESYEGRPLLVAYVGSPENIANLKAISSSNRSRALLEEGEILKDQPIIIWLSYNIHGNEAVSVETAVKMLYELAGNAKTKYANWLEKAVIVIDPCLNPDGHTRYVQFFNEKVGFKPNVNLFTQEHHEQWPGGRPNHYLFDLNRDWAWQTQKESKHRGVLFNRWMPHVHVDFHEMGINESYFFAPSAEPIHGDFSEWLREFQNSVGKQIGDSFDRNNWLYFKGEWFDLLYPSYGDTYPAFNGAVGMTFEMGGSGRAGLAGVNKEGDTVSLKSRIDHHYLAGMKTIEASIKSYDKLLENFEEFFSKADTKPGGKFLSYIVRNDNADNVRRLEEFLKMHEIKFGYLGSDLKKATYYSYNSDAEVKEEMKTGSLVIPAAQPKGTLLKVLFEPKTFLSDSNTYDITAWALPYAMGLNAFGSEKEVVYLEKKPSKEKLIEEDSITAIAYGLQWKSVEDAAFLAAAMQEGIFPRVVNKPMRIGERTFDRGSLIFTKAKHEVKRKDYDEVLMNLAHQHKRDLTPLISGYSETGPSLGSVDIRKMTMPHVGLLSGEGTDPNNVGEIWHFFEMELDFPISLLGSNQVSEKVLDQLDVLIMTGVSQRALNDNVLKMVEKWVESGGRLIAIEKTLEVLAISGQFGIEMKADETEQDTSSNLKIKNYSDRVAEYITNNAAGSIVKVQLDNTHPLAYGYRDEYFALKTSNDLFAGLEDGWNVGICTEYPVISGFVGKGYQGKMKDFMTMGVEKRGEGNIIYFSENPIFRSFWHAGKLMLCNAVFLVE